MSPLLAAGFVVVVVIVARSIIIIIIIIIITCCRYALLKHFSMRIHDVRIVLRDGLSDASVKTSFAEYLWTVFMEHKLLSTGAAMPNQIEHAYNCGGNTGNVKKYGGRSVPDLIHKKGTDGNDEQGVDLYYFHGYVYTFVLMHG